MLHKKRQCHNVRINTIIALMSLCVSNMSQKIQKIPSNCETQRKKGSAITDDGMMRNEHNIVLILRCVSKYSENSKHL